MIGIIRPISLSLISEFSPSDLRSTGSTILSMGFMAGFFVAAAWGLVDNNTWMWKIAILCQIIPCLAICILTVTIFWDFDSPLNLMKKKQRPQAEKICSTYMHPDFIEYTLDAYQKTINKENITENQNNGICYLIKNYSYEFRFLIVFTSMRQICNLIT